MCVCVWFVKNHKPKPNKKKLNKSKQTYINKAGTAMTRHSVREEMETTNKLSVTPPNL